MLSICNIYTYYFKQAGYIVRQCMLGIYLAYISTNQLFNIGILYLSVHIISIYTAYSMHTVAKGRLWLPMRVLYRQKLSTADLFLVAPSTTLNFRRPRRQPRSTFSGPRSAVPRPSSRGPGLLDLNYLSLTATNLVTPTPTKTPTRHPPTNPLVLSHLAQRNKRFT